MLRTPNYGRWIIGNFGATWLGPIKKRNKMATETVNLKVVVDDAGVESAFNRMTTNAEHTQSAVDKVGQAGTEAFGELAGAVGQADRALASSVRTVAQYKQAISANTQAINDTEKALIRQRAELAKAQAQYARMDASTAKAKALKGQMDELTKSISIQTKEIEALAAENKLLNQNIAEAGGTSNLAAYQVQNLTAQFTDLAVQIGSGQGLFRPLLQQGPQIAEALGGAGNAARFFGNQAKTAAGKLLTTRGAAAALGLGLVAMIAIPVISFLSKSQKASEFFADKLAFVSGIVKELTGRLFTFGESLVGLIAGTKSWGDVTAAAGQVVAGGYAEAGRAAQDFERIQRRILAEQEAFIVQEARQTAVIEQRRQAAGNESLSIRERTAALKEAARQEGELEAERLRFARARFDRLAKEGELADGVATNLEEQRKLQAEIIKLQSSAASREFSDRQALLSLRREAADRAKQQREEQERLNEAVRKFREQLQALQNSQLGSVAALRAQGDAAQAEIDRTEAALMKLYAEQRRAFDLQSEFAAFRALTAQATEEKITAFIIAEQDKRKVAESQALRETEAAQKESLQNRLDAISQQGEALSALQKTELAQFGVRKVALEQQAAIAQQAFIDGLIGSDVVIGIRRQLATIQEEYNKLASASLTGVAAFKQKLFAALGLDEGGQQQLRAALSNVANNLVGLFDTINQSRIDALNAEIAETDKNISELQARVDEEQKRQQEGYANNLAIVTAALDEENKARAAALEERGKLEAKAAKAKLALDAAQQASDIVSASISLAASGAKGGIIGLVAALGGIALLARIIAQGKQIARQQRQGFKDGTEYVHGPGNSRSDSIPVNLSVGERVVDAKTNKALAGIPNTDLPRFANIGRQVAGIIRPDSIAAMVATIVAEQSKAQEAQRREQMEMMAQAYKEAAHAANDRVIAYWKTRPIRKMAQGGEVIEYHEGGQQVRQYISKGGDNE